MEKTDIDKIVNLRKFLINNYERIRDYKMNENALMKEVDHARLMHKAITMVDDILRDHVNFT